jgi:hypothetical protein
MVTQELCNDIIDLAYRICTVFNKVTLSALSMVSITTHVKSFNVGDHKVNILNIFENGVQDQEEAVIKESSRCIGDFANCFEGSQVDDKIMDKLYDLTLKVLQSDSIPPQSKLYSITAMGDLCVSNEVHFLQNID